MLNDRVNMDIRVVANYFGQPLPYLQLWLDSCGSNVGITWLFFTDADMSKFEVPQNVRVIKTSFAQMKLRIDDAFPYSVRYKEPWDFCAFRPTFGTIFADEIGNADYWGWADCDVIFGDLSPCIEACKDGAIKVMPKGHFSLVKNTRGLNNFIMRHRLTKMALASSGPGISCFDETAFPTLILPEYGGKQCDTIPFINTACRCGNYVLDETDALFSILSKAQRDRFNLPFVATWERGKMYANFALPNDDGVRKIEVAYFHFFRRALNAKISRLEKGKTYLIRPNEIIQYDSDALRWKDIRYFDKFRIHWEYYKKRLNLKIIASKLAMLLRIKYYVRRLCGWLIGLWFVVSGKRRKAIEQYDVPGTILSVFSHYPTKAVNEKILKWLLDEGFTFVSTDELLSWRKIHDLPKGRLAWLTFDDGWASLKDNVFPFLEKYNIPATIFVALEDCANKGPLLTREEICELSKTNKLLTFENHTLSHCKCDEIPATEYGASFFRGEIDCASTGIESLTNRRPHLMCYPYGRCNDFTDSIVLKNGMLPVKSNPGLMWYDRVGECRNLYYNDMSFLENSCRVAGAWLKIKSGR